jgi:hypothetical protein
MSFDAAVESLERTTGVRIPKRQAEDQLRLSSIGFSDFYESKAAVKPENPDDLLILSSDGKGVVMRYKDLRWETKLRARKARDKSGMSATDDPAANRKRMATVAAVYSTRPRVRTAEEVLGVQRLPDGVTRLKTKHPRPTGKRVWASLQSEPEKVIDEVFQEALRRDPEQKHKWVFVVDGDLAQLKRIRNTAKRHKVKLSIVCDFIHVLEYLWKAAHDVYPQGSKDAENWVESKALEVLRGNAGYVAAGMRSSATKRKLSKTNRQGIDRCARYLLNHRAYLKYDDYLSRGFPIASGVIEGTCKHLINDRLDITGARWSLYGAETVLRLRALWASGDLDEFREYTRKRHLESEHLSLFKDGTLPQALAS